jgi:ribosome-associated heat shock protein Hsp15
VSEAGHDSSSSVRVDKWLWAVRLYKTRTAATDACRGGHVRVNQASAKPATTVKPGDTVRDRNDGRERVVEVARVINKRLGAPAAAECYIDRSPPPPPREAGLVAFSRDRGTGRPTKRDRRRLDRIRRQ